MRAAHPDCAGGTLSAFSIRARIFAGSGAGFIVERSTFT